ncbi:hypothetical protein [Elizabethkingia meningoseptica]|uniref:hypothetical protein n=1 Tax=Elizabethkingia meningoseptica TaxID=238 RepID=UPI00162335D9|nr:hypothetical protein [Elizabethkingia meningoseptica]MBG0514073.1 hypothetical protein [Elizabethkingia meningoseptica]
MKAKLYFQDVDSTFCYPLEDHLKEAKEEGLTNITLVEAIPDNKTSEYIWCSYYGESGEKNECRKTYCSRYSSKSGRGVCQHRGKLYLHGESVEFKVD